jgi:hypothetical protein
MCEVRKVSGFEMLIFLSVTIDVGSRTMDSLSRFI